HADLLRQSHLAADNARRVHLIPHELVACGKCGITRRRVPAQACPANAVVACQAAVRAACPAADPAARRWAVSVLYPAVAVSGAKAWCSRSVSLNSSGGNGSSAGRFPRHSLLTNAAENCPPGVRLRS